jgi:hypothetical protein
MVFKTLPLLLILLFTSLQLSAQQPRNKFYASNEITIGNYKGFDMNFNFINKRDQTLKIGYSCVLRKSANTPENFSNGLNGLFSFGLSNPLQRIETFQVSVGKILPGKHIDSPRWNLTAGLGYTTISTPTDWQPNHTGLLAPNYTYDFSKQRTISVILSPKIEFPIFGIYGFSLSSLVKVSPKSFYAGIGFGSLFGRVR